MTTNFFEKERIMTAKRIITEEFVNKVRELGSKGLTRTQIASEMHCSYSAIQKIFVNERLGIDRSSKQPWTLESLQEFRDCYQTMPIRELCLKFNRDKAELRKLLYILGWYIPDYFFQESMLKKINKIKELSTKYNQLEISKILNIPPSSVQAICQSNSIKCLTSHNNVNGETADEHSEEPKVEEPKILLLKEDPKPKKTPQQLLAEAYREQADAIRNKLREQFK